MLVSQPSEELPLQSARAVSHAPTPHAPSEQTAAPWGMEQGVQLEVAQPWLG